MPSGTGRINAPMSPTSPLTLDAPLVDAEFLAVDTETNGQAGDACEMTEVGAVLVGGGELHDRFSSLVRVQLPLRRGIQRFTGISQAMLEGAPDPEPVLRQLACLMEGRVLVAHNAPFDRRVLRQAFARAGLEWPEPPMLCTAALARRVLPLQRERRLVALAAALGVEVSVAHRALPDAETCGRILCALFPRLCAQAVTVGEAVALLCARRARRQARPTREVSRRRPAAERTGRGHGGEESDSPALRLSPSFAELPRDPGVYLFRDERGRTLYVGKSVSVRSRARAHFAPSAPRADWTDHATVLDYRATRSELGALLLENRLIKELHPPGNLLLRSRPDSGVYVRCRLDVPFPVLEVAPRPAAGHGLNVGPLGDRRAAVELVEQLDSLFGLRHCGRALPRREHPSAYGQMGRCLSPCLGDLDPNLYRRRLDAALALLAGEDPGAGLLTHLEAQMREAAERTQFERAGWLRRRRRRLARLLRELGGVLEATHARPRLILAPHPTASDGDLFWLSGGRVADWGPLEENLDPVALAARCARALARAGRPGAATAHLPPDEVDEVRIISGYLSSHPDLVQLPLSGAPDPEALRRLMAAATRRAGRRRAPESAPDPR
jgi:DNA polymerase-3 subunit epsilon